MEIESYWDQQMGCRLLLAYTMPFLDNHGNRKAETKQKTLKIKS